MEDLQVIIYIIFGIIYLIFSVLKKRNKGPETGTPPIFEDEEVRTSEHYREDPANRPPGSLEELLERYDQAAERAKRRSAEKTERMQEQVDDEFIPVSSNEPTIRNLEAEALEQMERTERLKSLQEELSPKARAEAIERERAAGKAATVKRNVTGRKMVKPKEKRFKAYEIKQQVPMANQIRTMLSSREGMKKAFILSEILNRKHF